MARFIIRITEYPKKRQQATLMRMMMRSALRYTGYNIVYGNNDDMKNSVGANTIDGITRVISQDIFKDRYMQVVTLSLEPGIRSMFGVDINSLEPLMDNINNTYTKDYNVLIINIIPWEIYNNSDIGESEADEAALMFRKYGYMNISGKYDTHSIKTTVPPYVQVRFNDNGCIPFCLNGEIW